MIEVRQGTVPLVLGLPHGGTELADDSAVSLNETGLALADFGGYAIFDFIAQWRPA